MRNDRETSESVIRHQEMMNPIEFEIVDSLIADTDLDSSEELRQ